MYLKYLIVIVSTIMVASSEISDVDQKYSNLFVQIESVKNTIDILKVRLDEKNPSDICALIDSKFGDINTRLDALIDNTNIMQHDRDKQSLDDLKTQLVSLTDNFKAKQKNVDRKLKNLESHQKILVEKLSEIKGNSSKLLDVLNTVKLSDKSFKEMYTDMEEKYLALIKNKEKILEKEAYDKKPLFDVRVDQLPAFKKEHCQPDSEPSDCRAATKCTQKSGYYNIYLPGNKAKQIMVFCDMEIAGGNWMHILRRIDGSENFNRTWSDYVNGFGKVENEYWIGLDNLNALTNNNGRQLLYMHLDYDSDSSYALYDNFLVGDASELYKLKSLGKYNGTTGDMSYKLNMKFSTFDNDNDELDRNCAAEYGGWWYSSCEFAEATGDYEYSKSGTYIEGYKTYYYKTLYFMIRSF